MDDDDRFFDALEAAWIDVEEEVMEVWYNALRSAAERDMRNEEYEEWFETCEEEWFEALEEQAKVMNHTHIPIDDMIENIVSGRTRWSYYDDTLHFIKWCITNKPTWVTTYCKEQICSMDASVRGMRSRERNRLVKDRFKVLQRNIKTVPLVHFDLIGARDFMTYFD
jgi:hypothetical protein